MSRSRYNVIDFVLDLPAYVFSNAKLNETLTKMSQLNIRKITVIDEKTSIKAMIGVKGLFKFIKSKHDRSKLDTLRISDVLDNENYSIVVYPESSLDEILSIMISTKLNCLPVATNPMENKLIGFINKKDIEKLVANY